MATNPGSTTGPGSAGHTTPHPVATPPPKPPAPKPPAVPAVLSGSQQSIYDLMAQTLSSWGLSSLSGDLKSLILKGDTSPDTLSLALSQTQAYKTRFAGNAARVKAGLSELTPAQYIAMEDSYKQVLNAYGIGDHFGSKANTDALIGHDVSAAELQAKAQVAHDQYMAAPPATRALWEQYYGTKGDMIAAILDPDTAMQTIQDRGQQVAIGGAAAALGFDVNQKRAQQFQQAGVTLAGAQKAYSQIAQSLPTDQTIAQRFGATFGQSDEENDLLLGNGNAAVKRSTLYDEEKGLFKSNAAVSGEALGTSQSY